jgi:hypothetical protein
MTQIFQRGAKRYANVLGVLIALAVVSSILPYSGCGMTSRPNIPTPTPTPDRPTVASFSPSAGAVNVSVDTKVLVTFSRAMDATTVSGLTIELRTASSALVQATVSYNSATFTATLSPDAPLATKFTYTVRVRGGGSDPRVKDLAGNALAADVTWTFTTAPPPLKVFATYPSDTSTGTPTGVAPIAFFTKPLDPKTVNATTVLLTDGAGASVPFNLFYDKNFFTLRLVPAALLQPEQKFTVTLKGGSASPHIIDTDGLSLAADVVFSFSTAAAEPPIPVSSLFAPDDIPDDPIFEADGAAVELGLKFRSEVDGLITGVRFYKGGAVNGGPHVGHLWTGTGTLLGSVTFSNETESGWQQAFFLTPIQITAGTVYVVSYFAPQGNYAVSPGQLASSGVDASPLHALSSAETGGDPTGNGVFFHGPQGGFPNESSNSTNYWVDVIFTDGHAAPRVLSVNPAPGAAGVSTGVEPTASFSEPLDPTTVNSDNVQMFDTANFPVPVTVSYEPGSFTVRVTPQAPLLPSQAYTVFLGVTDSTGVPLAAPYVWSFSTAPPGLPVTTFSIFAPMSTPANPTDLDAQAIEVGLKFRSNIDGFITGVRFYKGDATNGGPHVGRLWTSAGTLLGSVKFTNETDSGWQQAIFPTPIPVTANTGYVVSYFSPHGHYANGNNSFDPNGVNNDPLFALSNSEAGANSFGNGVYLISPQGGFPVFSNLASNYWVDVIFVPVQP